MVPFLFYIYCSYTAILHLHGRFEAHEARLRMTPRVYRRKWTLRRLRYSRLETVFSRVMPSAKITRLWGSLGYHLTWKLQPCRHRLLHTSCYKHRSAEALFAAPLIGRHSQGDAEDACDVPLHRMATTMQGASCVVLGVSVERATSLCRKYFKALFYSGEHQPQQAGRFGLPACARPLRIVVAEGSLEAGVTRQRRRVQRSEWVQFGTINRRLYFSFSAGFMCTRRRSDARNKRCDPQTP